MPEQVQSWGPAVRERDWTEGKRGCGEPLLVGMMPCGFESRTRYKVGLDEYLWN